MSLILYDTGQQPPTTCANRPKGPGQGQGNRYVHARRAAGDLAAFLQAVKLPTAIGLVLALHKVIIIGLAAVADKVGRAQQERGCGTDLVNLGDVRRHRRRVHQQLLVESVSRRQEWLVFGLLLC